MGCAQPTTGWKENPHALPEATLFHESGWSQKCHELQFHSKWRRDIRKVFLQASSKYKFTCLCCLKRHLESKPKITSSLRIYINLCNMIRKIAHWNLKMLLQKPISYGTKTHTCEGDHGPLYCRKGTCKNNWIIKGQEQCRIYFSFCSLLPAQKPFLSHWRLMWHRVTPQHSCNEVSLWERGWRKCAFFQGPCPFAS